MRDYKVLAQGFDEVDILEYDPAIWSPESIVERDPESYEIENPENSAVSAEIEEAVEEAKRKAEESGAEFYNGPLVRVKDFEVDNGVLGLKLQNTNYFSHAGTREQPELGKENRADPLSVGAFLTTSDHRVVLGEKSGLVEYGEGEYQLPGAGFVEDPEKQYERSMNAEPSSPIHRELSEEVNLQPSHFESLRPEALVGAVHRQPMLIYDAETDLTSEEVAEQWRGIEEADREFSELIFLPEDIDAALEGESDVIVAGTDSTEEKRFSGELRPHAEGTLSL